MIDDTQVPGYQLVFQARSIRDHYSVSLIGDNDTGTSKPYTLSKPYVPRYSEMVELGDIWDRLEPLFKVLKVCQSKRLRGYIAIIDSPRLS